MAAPQLAADTRRDAADNAPSRFHADAGATLAACSRTVSSFTIPDIVATITGGISFVGVDYVSWPAYTADLMINLHTDDDVWSWFADEGYTDDDNYFLQRD